MSTVAGATSHSTCVPASRSGLMDRSSSTTLRHRFRFFGQPFRSPERRRSRGDPRKPLGEPDRRRSSFQGFNDGPACDAQFKQSTVSPSTARGCFRRRHPTTTGFASSAPARSTRRAIPTTAAAAVSVCVPSPNCINAGAPAPAARRTALRRHATDIGSDTNNCGACGNVCLNGGNCTHGACGNCNSGKTYCPSRGCTNLATDPHNCGDCGYVCQFPPGICYRGACYPQLQPVDYLRGER